MGSDVKEYTSTRIIGHRELTVDGVSFRWWAVGDNPILVTVRTSVLGSLAQFTCGDPAECAALLAKQILARHSGHTKQSRKKKSAHSKLSPLEKPGWFQRAEADPSSTIV